MSYVKSPYNFIPAAEKTQVLKPDWADQVSHDIPFSEGDSGEFEIEITAETPIFIRDGQKKDEKSEEFSHFLLNGQKQYFIPATSLKGMVRSVLEMMSFSRLNKEFVHNSRFSQRDISTADTQYMKKYQKDHIKAGWLLQNEDGNWAIEECDSFSFIDHRELKDKLNIPFRDYFLVTERFGKPKKILKSAKEKYDELRRLNVGLEHSFSKGEKKLFGNVVLPIATVGGDKKGTLVLTGQPAKRIEEEGKKASGKVREFVFFNADNPNKRNISKDLKEDIKFIYKDHDKLSISPDWEYFRDNFLNKEKKVPVFFSPDGDAEVKHFGLAYMYKLPYEHKTHDLSPLKKYDHSKDFVQTLFGYTTKEKNSSLKGRVFFGHALAEMATVKVKEKPEEEILSAPKASYFPFYLNQFNPKGDYFTYDDPNASLKGFKRYPVREKAIKGSYDEKQIQNKKTWAKFSPIQKGAFFKSTVRFHNLKKEELGGLISALTFHGNNDLCFHSLGGAKPLGYGRIRVNVKNLITERFNWVQQECLISFENKMQEAIPNWINSLAITELFSMTMLGFAEETLVYAKTDDYQEYKKKKDKSGPKELQKLDSYSSFSKNTEAVKRIKPASIKYQTQGRFEYSFESYLDLQKTINDKFEIFGEFSEENKKQIYHSLVEIISIQKHKESIKKIRKRGHWDGNILNWLGLDLREKLQQETGIEIID